MKNPSSAEDLMRLVQGMQSAAKVMNVKDFTTLLLGEQTAFGFVSLEELFTSMVQHMAPNEQMTESEREGIADSVKVFVQGCVISLLADGWEREELPKEKLEKPKFQVIQGGAPVAIATPKFDEEISKIAADNENPRPDLETEGCA
jgi:hypothetical protein